MGPIQATAELEFDYAGPLNGLVFDHFEDGTQISALFQVVRGVYAWSLYLPSVFVTNAVRAAGMEGATTLTASGQVRWIPGTNLAAVDYVTEGSTLP